MINISVTILTKNSSKHIREVLSTLNEFDEIVILDNGSTDNTIDIAKSFSNVKVHHEKFIGFGPLKNIATDISGNDWIFSLDSDEVPTRELIEELRTLDLDDPHRAFMINRKNFFCDREIRHCGWSPDLLLRIFNRKTARFNSNHVHENVVCDSQVIINKLNGSILHYTADNIEDIISKMNHYSSLYAGTGKLKKRSSFTALMKGLAAFIKAYVLRLGFLEGWRGLVIAVMAANGAFFKHAKTWESLT
ncbi:MAG: glycosyltransferase family 2 protein [Nitrospiraceae bacterium]|nr:MAG: glycosyltransferase family 2 protein [Nitrospiraceae bacterium]